MRKYILRFIGIGSIFLPVLIIAVILIIIITSIGEALGMNESQSQYYDGSGFLSSTVLAYEPTIEKYCKKYGIADYVQLILAIMQNESGGSGTDPMQCSESPLNTKYPQQHNSITDPDYSINVGVMYFESCLRAAHVKSPQDMPGISLSLQGYNFGGGYINWAIARGGYSSENAAEFSQLKAQKMGWTSYGDVNYVPHVLRYYSVISNVDDGYFNAPLANGTYSVSSGYGMRDGKLHKGIDFAAPEGTKIYASASGTVVFAGYGLAGSGFGGYENVVLLRHGTSYSTLYGHCSQLLVTTGASVQKGSVIALVGSTGDSTGNHCHFEIRVNGSAVNPASYLNKSNKLK